MIWSIIIITFIFLFPSINSTCPHASPCLHNGLFNNKTCNCSCYSAYAGFKKEIILQGRLIINLILR